MRLSTYKKVVSGTEKLAMMLHGQSHQLPTVAPQPERTLNNLNTAILLDVSVHDHMSDVEVKKIILTFNFLGAIYIRTKEKWWQENINSLCRLYKKTAVLMVLVSG